MKPLFRSFSMFLRQIARDNMLWAVCMAPLLAAAFFRYGIPVIGQILNARFGPIDLFIPYYPLIDLTLMILTPYMFCFASAMVMLTEYDEYMTLYMAVTPIGKRGYLLSRLLFPAVISFFASVALLHFFALSVWSTVMLLFICALNSVLGFSVSLLLFSFSHNRVEGMAMAKLSGLLMVGLFIPFFLKSGLQYLFMMLPSFWIAKYSQTNGPFSLLAALLLSITWLWLLYRKFQKKLSSL